MLVGVGAGPFEKVRAGQGSGNARDAHDLFGGCCLHQGKADPGFCDLFFVEIDVRVVVEPDD